MRIDSALLHFCAQKTQEIASGYDAHCVLPGEGDGFPRSVDDLDWIMQGIHGKPIKHWQLKIDHSKAKYRSFYVHRGVKFDIYYAAGLPKDSIRYYKTKELLQIHLWQESLKTNDIVELVQNMILRASPESLELDLGHAATSDTLGEVAAMEFLFPFKHRLLEKQGEDIAKLAAKYGIPPFVVQRCFNLMEPLRGYFGPKEATAPKMRVAKKDR